MGVSWTKIGDFPDLACAFVQNMVLNSLVLLEYTPPMLDSPPPMLEYPLPMLGYAGNVWTYETARITFEQGEYPYYRADQVSKPLKLVS